MMEPGKGVLISGRERPALVEMPAYYDVPVWRAWAGKTPAGCRYGECSRQGVRYLPLGENKPKTVFTFPNIEGVTAMAGMG